MTTTDSYTYNDYAAEPDPSHRPMYLAKVLAHLKRANAQTVLDVGCGGGDFATGLAEAGLRVYGLDASESGVAAAQARGIGQFLVSSVYDDFLAPFSLDTVDAVVSVEVIEHLYSPRQFVRRAKEALKPGGLLIVTTPYWGYFKNIVLAVSNRLDRYLTALWDGGHIKHWSRETLTTLMLEQGFEEVAFHGCGHGIRAHTPYLWSGMIMVFRKPR